MSEDLYRETPAAITLGPNRKHCFACANILDVRAELCPKCGIRQPPLMSLVPTPPVALGPVTSKNRTTAALLALLLGGIGIHHFYLGRPALGILSIVFCWTFIPGLIAFVQSIIYFTQSDADFARANP